MLFRSVDEDEVATTTATVARRPTVPMAAVVITAGAMITGMVIRTTILTAAAIIQTAIHTHKTNRILPTQTRTAHAVDPGMATEHHLAPGVHQEAVEGMTPVTRTVAHMAMVQVAMEAAMLAVGTAEAATEVAEVGTAATAATVVVVLATTTATEATVAVATLVMVAMGLTVGTRTRVTVPVLVAVMAATVEAAVMEGLSKPLPTVGITVAEVDTTRVAVEEDIEQLEHRLRFVSCLLLSYWQSGGCLHIVYMGLLRIIHR